MKKLLLILLLLPMLSSAQWVRVRDVYYGNTKPTFTPPTSNSLAKDTVSLNVYRWYSNKWNIDTNPAYAVTSRGEKGDTGAQGVQGAQGIQGVKGDVGATGQTGAQGVKGDKGDQGQAGSQGQTGAQGATGSQGIQGIKGDKGDAGVCPTCPPSGGGSIPGMIIYNSNLVETLTQITVFGTGTNTTIGAATYPGIVTTSTDLADWANLQYALYLANSKKKSLISAGSFNTMKGWDLGKMSFYIFWDGQNNTWLKPQNTTAYSIIGRAQPVDNGEANQQISNTTYVIQNIRIQAKNTQIGLEPGPSYSSEYRNIRVYGALTAIHLRFSLNTLVERCDAGDCLNGFIADCGNWAGASYTSSNSQSNVTTFRHCHVYAGTGLPGATANVGIGIYGSSGCVVQSCIIEGGKVKRGIDFDFKMSPNVKGFTVDGYHNECVYGNGITGSGEASIYLRLVGVVTIKGNYSQYGGCFIDASGLPGQLTVDITKTEWTVPDNGGKLFNNAGGVQWIMNTNSYQSNLMPAASIPALFAGTAVTQCTGTPATCSTNKFILY